MDPTRFDALARNLAAPKTRRGLLGSLAALGAGMLGAKAADAQVTQAQCGNVSCRNNPGKCKDACVCCVYANGNSRCRPPGRCGPGQPACPPDRPVLDASGRCVAASGGCSGPADCEDGDPCTTNVCNQGECVTGFVGDGQQGGCDAGRICCAGACKQVVNGSCGANGDCCSGICQGGTCVATLAGTCPAGVEYCSGRGNFTACGKGCVCASTATGEAFCANNPRTCASDCVECGAGETCLVITNPETCCGPTRPYLCALPCPPEGSNFFSCFTGETLVAMADGTTKPIAGVRVGDRVLGQTGINRVMEIERPLLGTRRLYALNDGPFFVTAEHPFLTDTGWKAIDPAATAAENPRLVVGRLAVGDRLLALAGVPVLAGGGNPTETVVPELTAVAVEQIRETRADPATPLYNLRLDGDHTYVANDVVVHNK